MIAGYVAIFCGAVAVGLAASQGAVVGVLLGALWIAVGVWLSHG